MREPGNGNRDLEPENRFPDMGEGALDHVQDVVLRHEGHLEVELGELRLPVRTQVLVAVTAHDLEVAVQSGHHQQLLVELG